MGTLWQDIRCGLRLWLRNPGFAAVGVISLAVGLGVHGLMAVRIVKRVRYYGVSPYDSATLGVVLLAAWIPARRAAKVDPMAALRWE